MRAAIEEANNTPGADTINFNIGGRRPSVKTINVGSTGLGALPDITEAVTINGYTQRGSRANTLAEGNDARLKVQLNGANAGTNVSGLDIRASNSIIKGLVINRFSAHGILISGSGATSNNVEGNFIGTNATGTNALGNDRAGVLISLDAEDNTIGGTQPAQRNVISGNRGTETDTGGIIFGAVGIRSSPLGNQGNQVLGNFIGTNAKGTGDLGNGGGGVRIFDAPNNTIGGTEDGARNIISGNVGTGVGVFIGSPVTGNGTGNNVEGNYIGTDVSGTQDLGNSSSGVFITGWSENTVGGTAAGAGNTISGNGHNGVGIFGTDHQVLGNYIGTDASGTQDLGNSLDGVEINESENITIGGTTSGAGNVISGNGDNGVFIFPNADEQAAGNQVMGNRIGTKADGTGGLGNDDDGVEIVNADNNIIGGTASGTGNAISGNGDDGVEIRSIIVGPENPGATGNQVLANGISGNGGDGVEISSSGATGNRVLSNFILANTGLGIDLGANGVTANDTGDADTGANNLQNFPVITSAIRSNTTGFTTITGTLNSNPSQSFTIQCFVAAPDPSDHGEGQIPVDTETVTDTDGDGNVGFSCVSPVPQAGQLVTATATNMSGTASGTANGDTSEFSLNVGVVAGS